MKLPSKIINYIQQLISLLLYSVRLELTPHDVLGERPKTFRYGHQQDSFEYLGFLLDQLHEEEKRCQSNANQKNNNKNVASSTVTNEIICPSSTSLENGNAMNETMEIDEVQLKYEVVSQSASGDIKSPSLSNEFDDSVHPDGNQITNRASSATVEHSPTNVKNAKELNTANTMIQKLFGGQLSIKCKCLNCSSQNTSIENFFDLQLSFPPQQNDDMNYTTQSLINSYFSTEQMNADNQYYCDKCNQLCDGERNITLEQGPQNLILVIKHFKYDRNYHVRRKLLHKVHHDEMFTMIANTQNNKHMRLTYKLYAVIVHCGMNIDSGHYYTYAVNGSNVWYKFNDSHISQSSFNEIKNLTTSNTPYILFYELFGNEEINVSDDKAMELDELSTSVVTPTTEMVCRKRKSESPQWDGKQ